MGDSRRGGERTQEVEVGKRGGGGEGGKARKQAGGRVVGKVSAKQLV